MIIAAWSPLIGREQDIETLACCLPQQRLVTLWGPGGSGKTRLALQVMQQLQNTFADGARWVDCADLHEPDLLIQHVRTTLGLHLLDKRAPLDALIEWLQTQHLLLVIDNGEHLLDACARLVDVLLAGCPQLHILVTSRELLNLPGEQAYHVRPLAIPPPASGGGHAPGAARSDAVEDWKEAGVYPAIQLFVERARMTEPDFALTQENFRLIVAICRLLDGLPLAIELAAARVRMLALEQLVERLTQGIAILGASNRLAPSRQQTLQATMTWSYGLLTPREQQLFRRLALAASSFDISLVEAWGEGVGETPNGAVDLLARLIDKSLITVDRLDDAARYRLLDTVRHFGREQLRQSDETEATYRLYSGWVRRVAKQAESGLCGREQATWLDRLETELPHIRAVIHWLLERGEVAEVIYISAVLVAFCEQRAHVGEASEWLERALAGAETIDLAAHAKALHALGALRIRRYRADQTPRLLTQAQDYLTQARDAFAQLDDQAGVASAWYHLGAVEFWRTDYQAARTCLEAGLKIVPKDAVALRAGLLHRLATTLCDLGEREESIRLLRKTLVLRRQAGDVRGLALTLANLGDALTQEGHYAQAREALYESLRHYGDLGDRNGNLLALVNLAQVALALEDPSLIQNYLGVALSSTWVECEMWLIADLFDCLARMAVVRRRPLQAAQLFGWTAALKGERSEYIPESIQALLRQTAQDVTVDLPDKTSWQARCAAAWREGQVMGVDEAFACALADTVSAGGDQGSAQGSAGLEGGSDDRAVATAASLASHPTTPSTLAPVRIHALAGGIVERDDNQAGVAWRYSKARELLFYLVDAPHRTRAHIMLALWPDATEEQASTHMRVTLYHLRKTLGDAAWVLRSNAGYAFNRSLRYSYDVEQFESWLTQARAIKAAQDEADATMTQEADEIFIEMLAKACALYCGDYLADLPPHEWIVQRQLELRRRYVDAQYRLGKAYQRRGNAQQALACYQQVTSCDPYHERAHAAILRCYVQSGQRSQAIRYYQDLRAYLRDELGVAPDPHITGFVKALLTQAEARS
jgi:predicted ATPase/DNA-binding SARP family transcriptional activator